jgi:hypothetical protein
MGFDLILASRSWLLTSSEDTTMTSVIPASFWNSYTATLQKLGVSEPKSKYYVVWVKRFAAFLNGLTFQQASQHLASAFLIQKQFFWIAERGDPKVGFYARIQSLAVGRPRSVVVRATSAK